MEETLNSIRNRPRFKLKTALTPDDFTEQLRLQMQRQNSLFTGKISSQESYVEVKTEDDPSWKPRLTLRAEVEPDEGTYIRGIFGPKPSVWTFFMFLYIGFGTMFILFGSLYYSMYLVKSKDDTDFSWSGMATLFSLLAILATYLFVKIGQGKSRQQMQQLRDFAEKIILQYEKDEPEPSES